MSGDQTASFIYLVLLGTVIGSYVLVANRNNIGRSLRHGMLWVLIFFGVVVAYGLWDDIRGTVIPRQSVFEEGARIEVPLGRDGHYHMVLRVNDVPIEFVVDTGATEIALTQQDAARAGIDPGELAFVGSASTANGTVSTARVRLDTLELGGVVERNVPAVVSGGEMDGSLLGMSYLNRFAEVSFGGGRMILTR
ncbi:TIGR02281 family clan AA aspartic protease [Tropicimonas sp. IMCC6043]|uniref:retropepsin-like aspartic protease family protein n=1 Tax=Tropicimonas sp. IMCC6043 TaxID=2510645 RepID=UPI00101D8967|nr:TIGR02281 family clan AA aspartic protease [Tropicimonas sp. IMCC6043]RYH11191.1 TIGR02281 family clan AA aspartic protease [Tropicimonas sp. IMCC6043]